MLRSWVLVLGLCCVMVSGSPIDFPAVANVTDWIVKYYADFNCERNCTFDNSAWGPVRYACTSAGTLVPNSFCSYPTNYLTYIDCKSNYFNSNPEGEYSIVAPSSCVCPSDCSSRGTCGFFGCSCDAGYTGNDCKLVECGDQQCNGRGTCASLDDLEIDTCICDDGYSTNDCSAEMNQLPPIPNILGVNQYSSWDQYGDNSPIFNESAIAQIYITLDPDDLSNLILPSNQDQRIYKQANFSFYNGATSERMDDIGFRIKGGSSRAYAKKSWKISFSHFVDDRKWAQQKKLSLKAAAMDPLYLREKASLASIRSMGGPAQRASHADLYINGQYWGLYIILEDPGSNQFLHSRFGNDDGSLWKIKNSNTLKWEGPNPDTYKNNSKYEAENDNAENDYTPLVNFLDVLNNCPDDQFETQFSAIFDVEFFLRTFVAEVATGNWDGLSDGNNYLLYYNNNSLFYYYRYDLDVSFGSVEALFHGATRNVWTWGQGTFGWRLINRVLSVPSYQSIYASYLMKVIQYTKWDPNGDYTKRLQIMHQEISSSAKDDKWHSMDQVAYSFSEFQTNLNESVVRPNTYPPQPIFTQKDVTVYLGISEFLEKRVVAISDQVAAGPPS